MSKEKWFLEMECTPGEEAVKIVEMTTQGLEYYIKLADKAAAGLEKTDSNSESSPVGKMLSNSIACYREIIHEKRSPSMRQTSLLPQTLPLLATTTLMVSSHPHQGKTLHPQNNYDSLKAEMMISIFYQLKYFLIKVCTMFKIMLLYT